MIFPFFQEPKEEKDIKKKITSCFNVYIVLSLIVLEDFRESF